MDGDEAGVFEADWTPYLFELTIHRGRKGELDEQAASELTLVLNNADGRFSPQNSDYTGLDHNRRVQVQETDNGSYRFTGRITSFELLPDSGQQIAVITAKDALAQAEQILVSMGNVIEQTTDLILNRILDLMEAGEIISNPGAEDDTTNYSAIGSTVTRETTAANVFEGVGSIKCVTDAVANHEGWECDLDADGFTGGAVHIGLFVKGTADAQMTIYADSDGRADYSRVASRYYEDVVLTGSWQYVRAAFEFDEEDTGYRILFVTEKGLGGPAQAVTFYVDALHVAPYANRVDRSLDVGPGTPNRVSFGEERADVALRRVVDSEPGICYVDGQGQFVFKNRDTLYGNASDNFGYESQGGSSATIAADDKWGCKFTLSHDAYVESISAYCKATTTANVQAIIYSDDSGAPDALMGATDQENIDDTMEWKTWTFLTPLYLPAGTYWLGLIVDAAVTIYYDAGDAGQTERNDDTYSDGASDPFGSPTGTHAYELSIYASYRYCNPELTWSDDNTERYQGLQVVHEAESRIRFVRITSQGDYVSGDTAIIWEYSPLPLDVPAWGWGVGTEQSAFMHIRVNFGTAIEAPTLTCSGTDATHIATYTHYGDYGIITLENASGSTWTITSLYLEGTIYTEASEQSLHEYEATGASPWVHRTVSIEMWFLGDAVNEKAIRDEAKRLGDRHVGLLTQATVKVIPGTAAYLADILNLELRDGVTLVNDNTARALGINEKFWIEGYEEKVRVPDEIQEFTFYLEQAGEP